MNAARQTNRHGVVVIVLGAGAAALMSPAGAWPIFPKMMWNVAAAVKTRRVRPNGAEGYRTAEVTLRGVDTAELSSKTFEAKSVPGLYFIGEVVDVTGHLGGFNFSGPGRPAMPRAGRSRP